MVIGQEECSQPYKGLLSEAVQEEVVLSSRPWSTCYNLMVERMGFGMQSMTHARPHEELRRFTRTSSPQRRTVTVACNAHLNPADRVVKGIKKDLSHSANYCCRPVTLSHMKDYRDTGSIP